MTPIIFHQTQTREQKLAQLAQEITKAGSLAEFFSKLTSPDKDHSSSRHSASGSYLSGQRFSSHR